MVHVRGGESGRKNVVNLKIKVIIEVFHTICPAGAQSEFSEQLVLEMHRGGLVFMGNSFDRGG